MYVYFIIKIIVLGMCYMDIYLGLFFLEDKVKEECYLRELVCFYLNLGKVVVFLYVFSCICKSGSC